MGGKVTKLVIFCRYHKSMTPCLFFSLHSVAKLCSVLKLEDFVLEITWNFVEKNAVDTLSHEIKKYQKNLKTIWNFSAQSSSKNENFVNTSKKVLKNRNWTFLVANFLNFLKLFSIILSMILSENCYASELFQAPSNLNHLISFATLRPLTRF